MRAWKIRDGRTTVLPRNTDRFRHPDTKPLRDPGTPAESRQGQRVVRPSTSCSTQNAFEAEYHHRMNDYIGLAAGTDPLALPPNAANACIVRGKSPAVGEGCERVRIESRTHIESTIRLLLPFRSLHGGSIWRNGTAPAWSWQSPTAVVRDRETGPVVSLVTVLHSATCNLGHAPAQRGNEMGVFAAFPP